MVGSFDFVGLLLSDPLSALIDERSTLLPQVSQLGDFQPGSISSPSRRCGKPTRHCAKSDDPGHGPHFQLTQKIDGKTVTRGLPSPAAVRKAQSEIDEYRRFVEITDDLIDVNRKICRLRPVDQSVQSTQEKNCASHPARSRPRSRSTAAHCFP
jgi:hypothetical protein